MISSGFAFIASHLNLTGNLPVEILPNHVIRRARDSEIDVIKEFIAQSTPASLQWVDYEAVVKEERYKDRLNLHTEPLPSEKWKYWVVVFNGPNHLIHQIEEIGLLLPVDFDIAFQTHFTQPNQEGDRVGWSLAPLHIVEKYTTHDQVFRNAQEITADQLASIGSFWRLHKDLSENHAFVRSALSNFSALRRVPQSSGLFVVGLFSIIESLITHAPRLTETLDSINHQIANKVILLRKRYERSVLPKTYFLHASEEIIWKKLYSYRSNIAHGTPVTFDGGLQVLKSHDSVVAFLRDNVREIISLALREPDFIADLRRC